MYRTLLSSTCKSLAYFPHFKGKIVFMAPPCVILNKQYMNVFPLWLILFLYYIITSDGRTLKPYDL